MKVLIPYDGTQRAENALLELQYAGLGKEDEILIVITDVFLPETVEEFLKARNERRLNLEKSGTCSYSPARRQMEEERFLSHRMRGRLSDFPVPNIKIETLPGNNLVSSEILEKAAAWKADLIILGSLGAENKTGAVNNGYKSGLWRILSEADCSVRLARGALKHGRSAINTDSPHRIIAVLNDSEMDASVIEAIARRGWTAESEVRLIKASRQKFAADEKLPAHSAKPAPFMSAAPIFGANAALLENENFILQREAELLEVAGLSVLTAILKANAPSFSISREILDWKPDSVFIADPKSLPGKRTSGEPVVSDDIEGMLFDQAKCSVEFVRSTEKN